MHFPHLRHHQSDESQPTHRAQHSAAPSGHLTRAHRGRTRDERVGWLQRNVLQPQPQTALNKRHLGKGAHGATAIKRTPEEVAVHVREGKASERAGHGAQPCLPRYERNLKEC
eukprot:1160437-Pelagomonas_calceolata.AAC.9